MKKIETELIVNGIKIMTVVIKGIVRKIFDDEKKHKPLCEIVDECEERLQKLEISRKLKIQQEVPLNKEPLGWETDSDAIERAKKMPPRGWVLYGIVREGSLCNFQSPEKAGKSMLARQIAHDYTNGTNSISLPMNVDNCESNKNEAYIYDAELQDEDVLERYESLNDKKVHRRPNAHFESPDQLICHISASISRINSNVLVIVDNVSTICPNFSKGDIDQVWQECRKLQRNFCERGFRLTFIFIHHTKAGVNGSSSNDRAGSVQWGRVGNLSLSLLMCNLGQKYRILKVINSRGKDELLAQGEVAVLRFEDKPYLHFEFDRKAEESDLINKKKSTSEHPPINETSKINWKLSEEEERYICENYDPDVTGLGSLAKYVLESRNIVVTEKKKNHMKNVVKRTLTGKGLYQGQKTKNHALS